MGRASIQLARFGSGSDFQGSGFGGTGTVFVFCSAPGCERGFERHPRLRGSTELIRGLAASAGGLAKLVGDVKS